MLLLVAVVLGRMELVAIAAPLAVGTALALGRRPRDEPQVELDLPAEPPVEGSDVTAVVRVDNQDPAPLDLVVARLAVPRWLALEQSDRPHATDLPAGRIAEVTLTGPALRWGRHALGPAQAYAVACDGLLTSAPVATPVGDLRVHPVPPPFRAADTMPRAAALVGPRTAHAGRGRAVNSPASAATHRAIGRAGSTGGSRCVPGSRTWQRPGPTATPRWQSCWT